MNSLPRLSGDELTARPRTTPRSQARHAAVALAIGLLRGCHPGPTTAVTATMIALAVSAGQGSGAVWVGLAVLAGQLSVGWSNDYLDMERDGLAASAAKRSAKPVASGTLPARLAGGAAILALAAAVPLSFMSGWRGALVHLAGITAAWSYNLGLKKTVASVAPYAVAFGLLPAFVTLGLPGHPWPHWWVCTSGALLGIAAHFANVLPDIPDDLAAGIRGLPHRLGEKASRLVSVVALVTASVLVATAPAGGQSMLELPGAGLTVTVITLTGLAALFAAAPWRDKAGTGFFFSATIAVAALDVALLIARGAAIS